MEYLSECPICGNPTFIPFLNCLDFFLTKEEFPIVICQKCGLKFVNPRPEVLDIGRYYESPDYVSHDSERKSGLNILYKQIRRFSIREKFKLVQKSSLGHKILDIGCGTGEFLFFCNQKGFETTGIEPGEKPRKYANTKYQLNVLDETQIDILGHSNYDIITLWHVLEHVHLLNERMNKIVDLLKPDGTLIIAVPNSNSWDALYYKNFWAAYDLPRHLYHFSQDTMKFLLHQHNLEISRIVPMKLDAFYISLLSEKYLHGKQNYLRAFINGIRSNNFARMNKNEYSSLIYVIKKSKNRIS